MKLARISKPLRSVQVRVMLAGDLNARLERYAQLLRARPWRACGHSARSFRRFFAPFVDADREFQSWSRSADSHPRRAATPASSNGSTKAQP